MKKILVFVMIMMIAMSSFLYANNFGEQTLTGGEANLGSLAGKGKTLLGTLQWVGYLVAIGMIIWVGIKYLTSGAGEKAKAKETLIPIVIGAVLVAGATWIASALFNAM